LKKEQEPVVVEERFKVPIETVWRAITEIAQMRQWYFDSIPAFKAEVGFETQFNVTNEGRVFPHLWRVTEAVPPKKIAYNWKYEGYDGDSFVLFELFALDDSTKLKVTHTVKESFPEEIPEFSRESGKEGWEFFIKNRLKAFLESA